MSDSAIDEGVTNYFASHLEFAVPGQPVPWQRVMRGKGRAWVPERTKSYKLDVATEASCAIAKLRRNEHWNPEALYRVEVIAYFADARKRDGDNVLKSVLDALNGVVWRDDSQAMRLTVEKRIDKANPRAEVFIEVIT